MYETNRLGQMILEHWQKHRPQMVEEGPAVRTGVGPERGLPPAIPR